MIHNKEKKIKKPPKKTKVYICSRTHTQIAQIIKELRRTKYRDLDMCVLGSRKQLCVNRRALRRKGDINEVCRDLCKLNRCKYRNNYDKIIWSSRINGVAHDIEDLVEVGRNLKACSYFGTKERSEKIADVIFCPYNYILDPKIRSAMNISLKRGIVVVDEAHNIEDVCRSATSASWSKFAMSQVKIDLEKCREQGILLNVVSPILNVTERIVPWFDNKVGMIQKDEGFISGNKNVFGHEKCVKILDKWGINNTVLALLASAVKEIREFIKQSEDNANSNIQNMTSLISDPVLKFIEEFTTMASYLLDENRKEDFKLAVIPSIEYDEKIRQRKTIYLLEADLRNSFSL
jgi:Rad3-related DNA helicase